MEEIIEKMKKIVAKKDELFSLVSLKDTKEMLKSLAEKYNELEVREDNLKEAEKAEKELRDSRYALQNIHKSNNDILNKIKKVEKDKYEGLIELVKPIETRIKIALTSIKDEKKKQKELEKNKEKERVEAINKKLEYYRNIFDKLILSSRDRKDLESYKNYLNTLEKELDSFEEFRFEARKLHAIYTSRIEEVEVRIKKEKELEELRMFKTNLISERVDELSALGYEKDNRGFVNKEIGHNIGVKKLEESSIKEWQQILSRIVDFKKKHVSTEANKKLSEITKITKAKNKECTTSKEIKEELEKAKKTILESVVEARPILNDMMAFMQRFDKKVATTKFSNAKSKELLMKLSEGVESLINNLVDEYKEQ